MNKLSEFINHIIKRNQQIKKEIKGQYSKEVEIASRLQMQTLQIMQNEKNMIHTFIYPTTVDLSKNLNSAYHNLRVQSHINEARQKGYILTEPKMHVLNNADGEKFIAVIYNMEIEKTTV